MKLPFFQFGAFNGDISLVVAFVIGLVFGYFLERGGLGSAKKLSAQFYFKDLTVFKVMFTAILTAMVGVFFLSAIGVLDISMIYLTPTHMWPMIVGGSMLGIGFIVGGYCPGTSMVSTATGRIDGMLFLLGVIAGIFTFGELYPAIEGFFNSDNMGAQTIYGYFNISYGFVVFAILLIAVLGFIGAEWVERKYGYKKQEAKS